jgi:hypothetical protein
MAARTAPATPLRRRFNVRVPMRDGVTLAADLILPAELPAPAVVARTPYGRCNERQVGIADVFARAGYVAVWVDVRGRGDSDGEFEPYRNDGVDGYDMIEWAAREPWCDGAIATWGGSYPGRIQWLAALQRPPSLEADQLAPVDGRPRGAICRRGRLDGGLPASAAARTGPGRRLLV